MTQRGDNSLNGLVKVHHESVEQDWHLLLQILQVIDMGLVKGAKGIPLELFIDKVSSLPHLECCADLMKKL
jgi:hypothetical protein